MVVITYQDERDRWLQNRNSVRAQHVREILDGTGNGVDAMASAIRYPLRQIHLAAVVWFRQADSGDELVRAERFVTQLAQSLGAHDPLFISVDRLTVWAWIPLRGADAASNLAVRVRKFAEGQPDAPYVAIGTPLPGVDGFRQSHRQAEHAGS